MSRGPAEPQVRTHRLRLGCLQLWLGWTLEQSILVQRIGGPLDPFCPDPLLEGAGVGVAYMVAQNYYAPGDK